MFYPATVYLELEVPGLRRRVPEGNLERSTSASQGGVEGGRS